MQLTKTKYLFVVTLCMALFLMLPLTTTAQTVNIPDANLRACDCGSTRQSTRDTDYKG